MSDLVIFALEGVLADSERIAAEARAQSLAAAGLPVSPDELIEDFGGTGFKDILLKLEEKAEVPLQASLLGDARPLTVGVPSTTVTSLGSLGTGLPPGQHGMVGYTSRVPSTGEILNALTWESDLVARAYQPKATFFERATICSAEWKQAAYPAAKSCSGLEPLPDPPISFGMAISRSTRPSVLRTWPLRPAPVDSASAV